MSQHLSTRRFITLYQTLPFVHSCIICTVVTQSLLKFCYVDKQAVSNGSCSLNFALKTNNQKGPSHFPWLTSSLEDDLARQQKWSWAKSETARKTFHPGTYLEFERLHVVGAGGEVRVDQSAATERSVVRDAVLLQPHAVPLTVSAVQALSVAT